MRHSIGDIVWFDPQTNNSNAQLFLGRIVARRFKRSGPYCTEYGVEQISDINTAKIIHNSSGGKILVFCQEDLDRLNNDVYCIYEFEPDIIGKSFYTWARENEVQSTTDINSVVHYINIKVTVGKLDDNSSEEDRGGLKYL
jgi:hypothetical protein